MEKAAGFAILKSGIKWLNINYNLVKKVIRDWKKMPLNYTGMTAPLSFSTDHLNFSMLITSISFVSNLSL